MGACVIVDSKAGLKGRVVIFTPGLLRWASCIIWPLKLIFWLLPGAFVVSKVTRIFMQDCLAISDHYLLLNKGAHCVVAVFKRLCQSI